jgi:poly(3-hydroxyoctanoate) depolymerase
MSGVRPEAVVRRVRTHGVDVRVSTVGQGPPLLLFMGIGASIELWRPLQRELAPRGRELIAIDLPGAGESPAAMPPLRMGGLADVALGVLDELGHDRVDVLGVSFGGAVAQEFALRAPQRTGSLVLAATSTGFLSVPGRPRVLMHMATPLRYWNRAYAQRIKGDLYGGRAREAPAGDGEFGARFERPPTAAGYFGQLWAGVGWTSLPRLHRLAAPTLVMAGDDDPIIPIANAHVLANRIPGARLHVVSGGGHLFLLEEAERCVGVIDEFLG